MAQPETFGAWVRHRRRELDLTQDELARRVGCARITVRKIEAEQLRPSKQMAGLLAEQLGIAPSEREDFLRFARSGVSIPPAAAHGPQHNLPLQLTSLIGRESDVIQACRLLRDHRLVTLTGSGGTGKTRLALQVAAEMLDTFRNGAFYIELAPLSDPVLVPNAIASVLGVRQEPGRPLSETLLDWLRNRQVLLIMDNCEHLLDACARFAEAALRGGSEPRILATSRQPLGMMGETCYRVPSLRSPAPGRAARLRVDQLQEYPAARLFIERATEALGTFSVSDEDVTSVAEICHRLDGIPLAIELAAARVRVLRVGQIAERLDDRFRLLTSGSRTALPRHQTLRSLIDWSHNLLSEPERALLRRLSVFAGGWTLEAAEGICRGEGIESRDVLDLLTELVDKSLIALDERAPQPRYKMLETIREYAHSKLLESGEGERLADRHLRYFLRLAEQTRPMLDTNERATWLPRLEIDHDNLLAALEWSCDRDLETARWLAGTLERFWFFGDHLSEARAWIARTLVGGERAPVTHGLAMAILASGCVAFNLEMMDEAQAALEATTGMWQQLDDPKTYGWAIGWLAYLLLQRGEPARAASIYAEHESLFRTAGAGLTLVWVLSSWGTARSGVARDDPAGKALLDEALALAQSLQDPFAFEMCYSSLGDWAMLQGDHQEARRYFLRALEWRRRLGTRWIIAAGLWQVASITRLVGEYQQAEPMYAEALTMARDFGDQRSEAHVAQELGSLAIHLGDPQRAKALLTQSLSAFRRWSDALGIARCLLGFADLRHEQGQNQRAARLLSFIERWLQGNHLQLAHFDRTNYERLVAAARMRSSEAILPALSDTETNMTLEEAIAFALEGDDVPPPPQLVREPVGA